MELIASPAIAKMKSFKMHLNPTAAIAALRKL
jgi:hypothetical protein